MEVIEVTEREIEVIEVIERGPQGPQGAGITTLTTQGDLLYRGATTGERLPIGTTGQILKVSSGGIPEWGAAPSSGVSSVSGTSPIVSSGGSTPAISITAATTSAAGSMSAADKTKLDGIASGAEVNVNADWNASSGDAQILNKPTIPSTAADVGAVPTSRTISAGTGLTGGGDLSANRTLAVSYGTTAGTACQGNDGRISGIESGSTTISSATVEIANAGISIDTADGTGELHTGDGGSISTNDGGGSIDTSEGGGSINTRGTGSIEFGIAGTRTTLTGTATADRAISLPNAAGTLALTSDITKTAVGLGNVTNNAQTQAAIVPNTAPSAGQLLVGNAGGTAYAPATLSGDATIASTGALTLANTSTARTNIGLGNVANVDTTNAANISSGVLPNARVNWAAPDAIGSTTRNTGAFTTLNANNGTLTASAPVLDLSQTWNNAAVTFTGMRFNVTNTASASQSALLDLQVGGSSQFAVWRNNTTRFFGAHLTWFTTIGFETSAAINGATPVRFCAQSTSGEAGIRASGNIVEVMGTTATNAQTFRIYNTFTDASNYERGFLRWSSNVFQIGTEKLGTGSRRTLEFVTDGTARWRVGDGSISSAPSLLALGNVGVFGTNESYNVVIATGAQGTVSAGVFSPNNANTGYLAIGESLHLGLTSSGTSGDVRLVRDAANVLALRNGASTPQAYRIYNTFASTTSFERANFRWASNEFIIDAEAGSGGGTLRGIKIGSATSSLLGFYGVTPVDQPATVADPAGGGTVDTEARTAINAIIDRLQELGLIA